MTSSTALPGLWNGANDMKIDLIHRMLYLMQQDTLTMEEDLELRNLIYWYINEE